MRPASRFTCLWAGVRGGLWFAYARHRNPPIEEVRSSCGRCEVDASPMWKMPLRLTASAQKGDATVIRSAPWLFRAILHWISDVRAQVAAALTCRWSGNHFGVSPFSHLDAGPNSGDRPMTQN